MQDECERVIKDLVKTAVECYPYMHISIRKSIGETVKIFHILYMESKDKNYLRIAVGFMKAYLELGFEYEEHENLFDHVLNNYGSDRALLFPKKLYPVREIPINKTQVRGIIGRWPSSGKGTMKINEVVDDIIERVKKHETGIFAYINPNMPKNKYELIIQDNETYFHDIRNKKYFTFKDNMI